MMAGTALTPRSSKIRPSIVRGAVPYGTDTLTLFLCGDVMLGRGIDQIMSHPSDPRIYEPAMSSAIGYVDLAGKANGPIRAL
jgi:poly-gamma-glutamate synthesis protein (capsule biosynthesis protein)